MVSDRLLHGGDALGGLDIIHKGFAKCIAVVIAEDEQREIIMGMKRERKYERGPIEQNREKGRASVCVIER